MICSNSLFITKKRQLKNVLKKCIVAKADTNYRPLLGVLDGQAIDVPCGNNNNNVLVVGIAGSGKTHNYIKSNLLRGDHLAIVIDRGEILYKKYGDYFRTKGNKVLSVTCQKAEDTENSIEDMVDCISRYFDNHLGYLFIQIDVFNQNPNTDILIQRLAEHFLSCKNTTPVHFYLDEFSQLNLPKIVIYLAVARNNNVGFSIIVQTIEQLKMKYAEDDIYQLILANTDNMIFTRVMTKTDFDILCKLIVKNDKDEIAVRKKCAEVFSDSQKQIAVIRECKAIICDKLNPDVQSDFGR